MALHCGVTEGPGPADDDVFSGRHTCCLHGLFREGLGTLQCRVCGHRTEAGTLAECIHKAVAQWSLWTNDNKVHVQLICQRQKACNISSADGMVRAKLRRTGVAWCGVQLDPLVSS